MSPETYTLNTICKCYWKYSCTYSFGFLS